MSGKRKFVIDCDPGTDDAQAIMMAVVQPDVEILGITTVEGNAPVDKTTWNALRILNLCQVKIPVFPGSNKSMVGQVSKSDGFHGKDGMGDIPDLYPPDDSLLQEEQAVLALIRLVRQNPGEITLIAVGPLTNLALAIRLDPSFGSNLKECFIMGGNDTGEGNITQSAEFNFYGDPEGAMVTLNEIKCPITIASLEICFKTSFSWEWYAKFTSIGTKKAKFIKDIDRVLVQNCKGEIGDHLYPCWDQLAMAAAIRPDIVTKSQHIYATVETQGLLTRGQMVIDLRGRLGKPPNVRIIKEVDMTQYEQMLYDTVNK